MKPPRISRHPVLLVFALLAVPHLHAGDWFAETSALYFTEDKRTGVSASAGKMLASQHYFGTEIIAYGVEETATGAGFTARSKVSIVVAGVTYKYFTPLTPSKSVYGYFGGGAGLGITSASASVSGFGVASRSADVSTNDFAAQAMAGIELPFSPSIAGRLGWRYVAVPSVSLFGIETSLKSNVIEAGLTFRF